jgi:hypothetical protein
VELPLVIMFAKLKRLNIRPSADPSDSEFLRRVYIDTIGLLPPEAEARAFFDSRDPAPAREPHRPAARPSGVRRAPSNSAPAHRFVTDLVLSQGAHLFGKAPSSFYNVSSTAIRAVPQSPLGKVDPGRFLRVRGLFCAGGSQRSLRERRGRHLFTWKRARS